jgi:cell wall-associated NlpC family hydrolase
MTTMSMSSDAVLASECERILSKYQQSLVADFEARDLLPQTEVARDEWDCCGIWGPPAARYPEVFAPDDVDRVQWLRDRVIEVGKRYVGFKYLKSHIPAKGGFDCSNFTAWMYNFGLGVQLNSNVETQAQSAGRLLDPSEPLEPGDLVFLWSQKDPTRIGHVVMHVSDENILHSGDDGVKLDVRRSGYFERYAWARRVIE